MISHRILLTARFHLAAAAIVSAVIAFYPAPCAEEAPKAEAAASARPHWSGYVDGSAFRELIDEDKEVVEVNLDGAILQAIAAKKDESGEDAKDLFGKLKSIHAVIGTVKGSTGNAMSMVQQLDRKLGTEGWQRITRIKDETSWVSVLTHTTGEKIDGLVAIIFDTGDRELVFANLAGEVDLDKIGEIGDRLHIGGLDQLPGRK